ncbi:hypothetical protein Tco_0557220 [Tanacetum coccineum]
MMNGLTTTKEWSRLNNVILKELWRSNARYSELDPAFEAQLLISSHGHGGHTVSLAAHNQSSFTGCIVGDEAKAIRTVTEPYVQDALSKHATTFKRNHEVLSLRRGVNVRLQEHWLQKRCTKNDLETISNFINLFRGTRSSHRLIPDYATLDVADKIGITREWNFCEAA